jgi:FOG: Ankyrin repeat
VRSALVYARQDIPVVAQKSMLRLTAGVRVNFTELELWLNRGVPVNARDSSGRTALMITAENGHSDATKYLLERGADINAQDANGRTALIGAVLENAGAWR